MDFGKTFGDPKLEQEGAWVRYHDGKLKIARLGNENFQITFDRSMKPYRTRGKEANIGPVEETRILCECIAESVLLGWENMTEDDSPVDYSVEAATRMLVRYQTFRNDVVDLAGMEDNFKREADEKLEGNSEGS